METTRPGSTTSSSNQSSRESRVEGDGAARAADRRVRGRARFPPEAKRPRRDARRPRSCARCRRRAAAVAAVQLRVRDEDLAGGVDALEQRLVLGVGAVAAEADERERARRGELPAGLVAHPALEERGEPDRLADPLLQPFAAVAAEHRPELERAEAPAEHRAVLGQAATSSLTRRYSGTRLKAARRSSGRRVQSVEQSIGVSSHLCGLTTTESARSQPAKCVAQLGAHRRRAGVGGVHVQPGTGRSQASAIAVDRVDRARRGRPDRRDDGAGSVEVERVRRAAGTRRRRASGAPRARAAGTPSRPRSARARS